MKKIIFLYLLFIWSSNAFGQGSLNENWNRLLDKSETYEQYKVIKRTELTAFWKMVQDSLSLSRIKFEKENKMVAAKQARVDNLEKELADVQNKLTATEKEKENMGFMGMEVNKYTYATILWFLIFLILAGAGVLALLYFRSNRVTEQKIRQYEDIFDRFEEYKKSKIEMERKLKRELQTQINLLEEIRKK